MPLFFFFFHSGSFFSFPLLLTSDFSHDSISLRPYATVYIRTDRFIDQHRALTTAYLDGLLFQ